MGMSVTPIPDWRFTNPPALSSLHSWLFVRLLEQASLVLKAYKTDLFHDAMFLHGNITPQALRDGSFTFFYGFDESGTECRLEQDDLAREHRYRYTIERETAPGLHQRWTLTVEEIVFLHTRPGA